MNQPPTDRKWRAADWQKIARFVRPTASTGRDRADIRAVLLDVNMPHVDGRDCLKQLQNVDPNVRVIMCSGFTEEALERDGAERGIAAFLKKPFRREDLAAAVSG